VQPSKKTDDLPRIACPICFNDPHPFGVVDGKKYARCAQCRRKFNLALIYWTKFGIDISGEKEIRCSGCGRMLGKGDYSPEEQAFKCRDCDTTTTFQRL
jgi:DNA-directed RNA polymerase subunit RPC12/RpoP